MNSTNNRVPLTEWFASPSPCAPRRKPLINVKPAPIIGESPTRPGILNATAGCCRPTYLALSVQRKAGYRPRRSLEVRAISSSSSQSSSCSPRLPSKPSGTRSLSEQILFLKPTCFATQAPRPRQATRDHVRSITTFATLAGVLIFCKDATATARIVGPMHYARANSTIPSSFGNPHNQLNIIRVEFNNRHRVDSRGQVSLPAFTYQRPSVLLEDRYRC